MSHKMINTQLYKDYGLGEIANKLREARWHRDNAIQALRNSPSCTRVNRMLEIYDAYDRFRDQYHVSVQYMSKQGLHTVYCLMVAHFRGKLHMSRVTWSNLVTIISPTSFWSPQELKKRIGSSFGWFTHADSIAKWTMDDQARLVEDHLRYYQPLTG